MYLKWQVLNQVMSNLHIIDLYILFINILIFLGMVLLHGEISSIKVDLKGDKSRITRLNNSKEII